MVAQPSLYDSAPVVQYARTRYSKKNIFIRASRLVSGTCDNSDQSDRTENGRNAVCMSH